MKLKLGFAISSLSHQPNELVSFLKQALKHGDEAVELSLTQTAKLRHEFNQEIIELLQQFRYRSIHAPVVGEDEQPLSYPSPEANKLLTIIDTVASRISPHTLYFIQI